MGIGVIGITARWCRCPHRDASGDPRPTGGPDRARDPRDHLASCPDSPSRSRLLNVAVPEIGADALLRLERGGGRHALDPGLIFALPLLERPALLRVLGQPRSVSATAFFERPELLRGKL